MAKLQSWSTIIILFLIWQHNIVTVQPDDGQYEQKLGLEDDGVTLRSTPTRDGCLRFAAGTSFKVALFADLHFGEDAWTDWGPKQDFNSVKVMSTVIDVERPGL